MASFLESWSNANWTPRGLKFKKAVEGVCFVFVVFGIMAFSGWGQ